MPARLPASHAGQRIGMRQRQLRQRSQCSGCWDASGMAQMQPPATRLWCPISSSRPAGSLPHLRPHQPGDPSDLPGSSIDTALVSCMHKSLLPNVLDCRASACSAALLAEGQCCMSICGLVLKGQATVARSSGPTSFTQLWQRLPLPAAPATEPARYVMWVSASSSSANSHDELISIATERLAAGCKWSALWAIDVESCTSEEHSIHDYHISETR